MKSCHERRLTDTLTAKRVTAENNNDTAEFVYFCMRLLQIE